MSQTIQLYFHHGKIVQSNWLFRYFLSLLVVVIFSILLAGLMAGSVESESSDGEEGYLINFDKGGYIKTSDPEITIWTKEDPFSELSTKLINSRVFCSPKLSKRENVTMILDIYEYKKIDNGTEELSLISSLSLRPEEFKYEGSDDVKKVFDFTLDHKYFVCSRIRYWSDDLDVKTLHLCRKTEPVQGKRSISGSQK